MLEKGAPLDGLAAELFALCRESVFLLDCQTGNIVAVNDAASPLYGFPAEELCGRPFRQLFAQPEEWDELLVQRRATVPLRYHVAKDGRHLPVEMAIRYFDANGDCRCLVAVTDVSDRMYLEREKRNLERKFSGVFGSAPYPILLVDTQRQIVDANQAAVSLYQLNLEELCSRRIAELLMDPRDAVHFSMQNAGSMPRHWHRRNDGSVFLAEGSVSLMREERATLMIVVVRDTTEEHQAIEAMRASEKRWRFALEGHGDGLWEWLPATGAMMVSERFLELLEFDAGDKWSSFDYWDARFHPDDYDKIHRAILQHLSHEIPLIDIRFRVLNCSGQYRWVSTQAKVMEYDHNGVAQRVIGTVRDIHDQCLQELRERLQQEQLLHTARLATMGELLTVIAHEVTQPLTAISTFAAAAQRRIAGRFDDDDTRRALEGISVLVARTGEIVHRIRGFVRKGETRFELLSVNRLIVELVRLAELQARALAAEIELDLTVGLPEIKGDRLQLGQLILNLARNGLEAMSENEGARQLRISTRLNGDFGVEIVVADLGVGLPTQVAMDVIEPFFTTKTEGLGMGLAICQTVTENHQGRMWAVPNLPRGTVFHVTLPFLPRGENDTQADDLYR